MKRFGMFVAGLGLALALVLTPDPAQAGRRYDSHDAGHPLRIAGYVGHAIGWTLDVLIFRPAWYVGQTEPIASIVGMYHQPEDLEDPAPAASADPDPAPTP